MVKNLKQNAVFLSLLLFVNIMTVIGKDTFKPKIDYDNSLTSVAASIQKYFDIEPLHNTLPYLDNLTWLELPQVALEAYSNVLKISKSSIPPVVSNWVIPFFP